MAITKQQKTQHVAEIKELISKSHSIIVWDYLGLGANEISELRNKIKEAGAQNTVYKNRLAKLALKEAGKEEILEHLTGPSSFLFTFDDNLSSLKEILKVSKESDGKVEFKAGYIDGEFYTAEAVKEIASLPSKDELLSMLLSVLQANMRNLAYSLSQVAANGPAEESAPAEEPKAEETKSEDEATADKAEDTKTEESTPEEKVEDNKEESTEEKVEEAKEEGSAPEEKAEETETQNSEEKSDEEKGE